MYENEKNSNNFVLCVEKRNGFTFVQYNSTLSITVLIILRATYICGHRFCHWSCHITVYRVLLCVYFLMSPIDLHTSQHHRQTSLNMLRMLAKQCLILRWPMHISAVCHKITAIIANISIQWHTCNQTQHYTMISEGHVQRFTKQLKSYSNFLTISSNNCLAVVSSSMFCLYVHNFQLFCRFVRPWLFNIWCTKTNRN